MLVGIATANAQVWKDSASPEIFKIREQAFLTAPLKENSFALSHIRFQYSSSSLVRFPLPLHCGRCV